jgi:hypothetical protein
MAARPQRGAQGEEPSARGAGKGENDGGAHSDLG